MDIYEKLIILFEYIKALVALGNVCVQHLAKLPWFAYAANMPTAMGYVELLFTDQLLLRVQKPILEPCPEPDARFLAWLQGGWEQYKQSVSTVAEMDILADHPPWIEDYGRWLKQREKWVEKQILLQKEQDLFERLYQLYTEISRSGGNLELFVGNGILTEQKNEGLCFPVLLKKVQLEFDASQNVFTVMDADGPTLLNTMLLAGVGDISSVAMATISERIEDAQPHPFDAQACKTVLPFVAHQLSSDSEFLEHPEDTPKSKFSIRLNPCFLLQKPANDMAKFIDQIIDTIQCKRTAPQPLTFAY